MPVVLGVILETILGLIVEIIPFIVLVKEDERGVPIIDAAILAPSSSIH